MISAVADTSPMPLTAPPTAAGATSTTPDQADWWALWSALSPRRSLRVDVDRAHVYVAAGLAEVEPACPYALYLADGSGRYRLVCFDLDASRGDVAESLRVLRELLDDAGVGYVVAESGPGGGRHVWSAWSEGLDAVVVRRLAGALQAMVPALDPGALQNPLTGCVRPIGAPHRHGGASRLLGEWSPQQAAGILTRGNPRERIQALLAVLPQAIRDQVSLAPASGGSQPAREREGLVVVDASGRPRLVGPRRELGAATRAVLTATPPKGADASAVAWSCLLGLALARWEFADVERLVADRANAGLEHLRSLRGLDGRRVARTPVERGRLLGRQWARAVAAAAALPGAAGPGVAEVAAVVGRVQRAADLAEERWRTQAGPCDRLVLDAMCLLALRSASTTVYASVRMLSEMTGIGSSTAARALARLADTGDGRAWLSLAEATEGPSAAVWRLLDVDGGDDQAVPAGTPVEGVLPQEGGESDNLASVASVVGGTQGNPPPGVLGGTGGELALQLGKKLDQLAADVWTPRGGLGHHTARTHAAIASGATTVVEVCWQTGYDWRTVSAHLSRLERAGLVRVVGSTVVATGRDLRVVARELGVEGVGARRRLRHVVERETRAWWEAEQAWRRRSGKRRGRQGGPNAGRRGPPVANAGQTSLPVAVDARHVYGRFPVRGAEAGERRGRADYATATRIVAEHLSRRPAVAA